MINHDIELSSTTDVSDVYPGRARAVHAPADDGDPVDVEGWVVQDFTLEEIKRLSVHMRHAKRADITAMDGDNIAEQHQVSE